MDLDRHDFQLEELIERIQKNDNRLVALQVPEGLKMQALEMMDEIESGSGAKVVLAADPCYGACDLVHDTDTLLMYMPTCLGPPLSIDQRGIPYI